MMMKSTLPGLVLLMLCGTGCGINDGVSLHQTTASYLNLKNGQPALVLLGEPDFNTTSGGTTRSLMSLPIAVDVTPDGVLRVVEYLNIRTVGYKTLFLLQRR